MNPELKEKLAALAEELLKLPYEERIAAMSFLMQQIVSGGATPPMWSPTFPVPSLERRADATGDTSPREGHPELGTTGVKGGRDTSSSEK